MARAKRDPVAKQKMGGLAVSERDWLGLDHSVAPPALLYHKEPGNSLNQTPTWSREDWTRSKLKTAFCIPRFSAEYMMGNMIKTVILFNILPMFFLTFFNWKIYNVVQDKMRNSENLNRRKKRDMKTSKVLCTIVFFCITCHILKTGLNVFELVKTVVVKNPETMMAIDTGIIMGNLSITSNFLIILNSSSNFFVYVLQDKK